MHVCDRQTGRAFRLGGVMETVRSRTGTRRRRDPNVNLERSEDEDERGLPSRVEQLLAALCSSAGRRRRASAELEILLGIRAADPVGQYTQTIFYICMKCMYVKVSS